MTNSPNIIFSRSQGIALFVAVAVAAGSTLCLQLVQTRVLSVLYYNHVVYLTVTLALLGFGISGVFVAIAAPRTKKIEELAAIGLCGFSLSVPICIGTASYLPVLIEEPVMEIKLGISYLLLTIPFIFSGLTLASIFMLKGRNIYRLYFCDLAASALGTIIFVLFLTPLGAEGLIWGCSFASMLGYYAILKAYGSSLYRAVLPLVPLSMSFISTHNHLINSIPDYGKEGCYTLLGNDLNVEVARWTTIAKIEVLNSPGFVWQLSPDLPPMEMKMITQDREAVMYISSPDLVKARWDSARSAHPYINCEAISFIAHPNPTDSLVIGVGGGNDIVNAVGFNAKHIVGIEINAQIISLMKHEYANYGVWPNLPNVSLLCMDGRSYVAGTSRRFDTINISGFSGVQLLRKSSVVSYWIEGERERKRV